VTEPLSVIEEFIRFQLEQMPARNAHHQFERLAVRIARTRISSTILLAVGPVAAGGDQGRDAESYRLVTDEYSSVVDSRTETDSQVMVVACTTQRAELPRKVMADVASICRPGSRPVDKVLFFSVEPIPVALVHRLQADAANGFDVELEVFSGDQVATMLAEPDLIDFAAHELNVPSHMYEHHRQRQETTLPAPAQTMLYGPTEWLPLSPANGAELAIRCTVAAPGATLSSIPPTSRAPHGISKLELESVLEETLRESSIAKEFRHMSKGWGWRAVDEWEVQGGSPGPSVVSASLGIDWGESRIRQPLALSCSVLLGQAPRGPAVVIAVDLLVNVIELDADRRPSSIAYRTSPPPAPAALSLEELLELLDFTTTKTVELAVMMIAKLVPSYDAGAELDVWLQHDGSEIERLVDLRAARRLATPSRSTRGHARAVLTHEALPRSNWPPTDWSSRLVASVLEANDYRDFSHLLQ